MQTAVSLWALDAPPGSVASRRSYGVRFFAFSSDLLLMFFSGSDYAGSCRVLSGCLQHLFSRNTLTGPTIHVITMGAAILVCCLSISWI